MFFPPSFSKQLSSISLRTPVLTGEIENNCYAKVGGGEGGGGETRCITMVHVKMVNKERSVADLDILIFSHGRFCDVAYNAHKLY